MPKSRKPKLGRIYKKYDKLPSGEKVYRAAWTIRFQGLDIATGTSDFGQAEKQLIKLISDASQKKRKEAQGAAALRVSDILQMVVDDYNVEDRDTASIEARRKLHLIPHVGHLRAADVTKSDVDKYKQRRLTEGAAKASINRELAMLRRGFSLVREAGHKEIEIPAIIKFREDNIRTGYMSHEQYASLYEELPEALKPVFCVAFHIGIRRGELLALKQSQVDLRNLEIALDPGTTKNKQGRTAPIYGEMLPVLTAWLDHVQQKAPDCTIAFPRIPKNGNWELQHTFYKEWDAACIRAGVPDLLFHDLRRTAVRNLTRAGVPRAIAMQITGHKTESVYLRYDIVDSADVRQAGKLLQQYSDKQNEGAA